LIALRILPRSDGKPARSAKVRLAGFVFFV
jgi:hypothetical protein